MKVTNDHRSKFSNLSNWKEEAWRLQQDLNPNGKIRTVQQFRSGKDFKTISQILYVAEATAEVYGIDAFVTVVPMDHMQLAEVLQETEKNLKRIKSCIEKDQEPKL